MCHTVYKYECGHARKEKKECRKRGAVSSFIKRVLYDEACDHVDTVRRPRMCSACKSHCPPSGEQQVGDPGRFGPHREGRSHRSHRSDREGSDQHESRPSHRTHRSHDHHDSHRRHHSHEHHSSRHRDRSHGDGSHTSHKTKRSDRSHHRHEHHSSRDRHGSSKRHGSKEDHNGDVSGTKQTEHRRRHRISEPTGYATQNQPEGWNTARADSMNKWLNGCESENAANVYPAANTPSASSNLSREQQPYPWQNMPDSGVSACTTPDVKAAPLSPLIPPTPMDNGYTPARSNWDKLGSLPKAPYEPNVPPRPASSVYPDAPPPLRPPTTYSAARMSEYETIYAETEVGGDAGIHPTRTDFTHPSSVPEALFSKPKASGTAPKPTRLSERPAQALGYTPHPWPKKPPPGKSRYANLPATESEVGRQEDRKARIKRAEEEARQWEEEQNAELKKEQATLREAMREWEHQQQKEREQQQEEIRQKRLEQQQQHQYNPHPPRSAPAPSEPMRQSTGGTYGAQGTLHSERPPGPRLQSVPEAVDTRWDTKIMQPGPHATPSTTGSQFLMNPRTVPNPNTPTPEQYRTGASERRMTQISDFLPRIDPPQSRNFHTVNPKIVEASWGTKTGLSSGKRSQNTSKSPESKNNKGGSALKGLGQMGRGILGKLYLHKEKSEESLLCQGARLHDSMNGTPAARPDSRRKR